MTGAQRYLLRALACLGIMAFPGLLLSVAVGQKEGQEAPVVIAAKMPLYPIMARAARIQGVVKMKVTTDGKKVAAVDKLSGPPMLVKFAHENILTWEFLEHKPTTFVTTFEYVIEGPDACMYTNGMSVLNLPMEIHLRVRGLKTCDPAVEIK